MGGYFEGVARAELLADPEEFVEKDFVGAGGLGEFVMATALPQQYSDLRHRRMAWLEMCVEMYPGKDT